MDNLDNIHKISATERMPVIFAGHGSPMNAIADNEFTRNFIKVVKTLPKPQSILCISAHWFTRGTMVTAMDMPKTIYDFYGFPDELYRVKYPAKGDPELAMQTRKLLKPTEVSDDYSWGLDHGTWSVLKHFYPQADVPVIQLSIDYTQPPAYHFNLGKRLSALRDKGVLILGSGNIVHNLRLVDFQHLNDESYGYNWSMEARELINTYLLSGDYEALINYQRLPKAVQLAIPSPDHYLPLLYILGLQQKGETPLLFNDKLTSGSLSMTSVKIG